MTSALSALAGALERLNIPYLIGGSLASSSHGVLRSTLDVDILARIGAEKADMFCDALGGGWYADPQQVRSALAAGRSFNVIHIGSARKFDIFPAVAEFRFSKLARAKPMEIDYFGERLRCPVATAEDILLAKLHRYRAGGSASERQWIDIAGILAANQNLDSGYLRKWAGKLGVEALLDKAVSEAG